MPARRAQRERRRRARFGSCSFPQRRVGAMYWNPPRVIQTAAPSSGSRLRNVRKRDHLRDVQRIRGDKVDVLAWADPAQIESVALDQLRNIAKLPWVFHHVAAMPDVHYGKGATVGSVIAMKGAVSPAAVGVDIGCGLGAIRTSLSASDLPDNLHGLRRELERAIPVGFSQHRDPIERPQDKELWEEVRLLTPAVKDLMGK